MQPPTKRQHEIAEFLESESRKRGMMPTHREIAARFGFASPNSVRSHLRLMEQKGMLSRLPGKARGLKLKLCVSTGIPVVGRIVAGSPREALQDLEEFLPISPQIYPGKELFALRVRGESMKDAGIMPGDFAILCRQEEVADGEIAAILMDDDATLKYFHLRHDRIILRGANTAFKDIVIPLEEARNLRIIGKYIGLFRRHGGMS